MNREDYPVDRKSNVPLIQRGESYKKPIPNLKPNGGLYYGDECQRAWISTPVYPTGANFTTNLLRSANPPPQAMEQAIGTNRPGNNYVSMPGVYWYNKTHPYNKGPYELKVTK